VEWPTGTSQASYDELNRPVFSVVSQWNGKTVLGVQQRDTFRHETEYNAGGQVIHQTSPGGLELDFYYNERGLPIRLAGGFEGDTRSIFAGIQYDHRGAITRTDSQNGTSTCSWYDNRSRLRGMMAGPSGKVFCNGSDPTATNPAAFQHVAYNFTSDGHISHIHDLTESKPDIPRFEASYEYDRLSQLTAAHTTKGYISYSYDTIQSLIRRTSDTPFNNLTTGEFKYGENGAGPHQVTSVGDKRFEYNEIGQMKQYNGFDLHFDVEGRLVKAEKSGQVTIEYYYGTGFDRKLTIIRRSGEPAKIIQYISQDYQIRDGEETWFLSGGHGQVEISRAEGLEIDLALLDEMERYVADPDGHKKPVAAEYMDLDGDGDDQ
ncbi:MAG: hypothetical protein GY842_23095, partial [bacterium]|nr:hypothetical protein [bacterium]